MDEVIQQLSEWLRTELAELPPGITAVYVEYGESVSPDQSLSVYTDAFGFERLAGPFDPSDSVHVAGLGDFVWQAKQPYYLPAAGHRGVDWLSALEAAARAPDIQRVAQARGLQLLVGEHDGEVRVIR